MSSASDGYGTAAVDLINREAEPPPPPLHNSKTNALVETAGAVQQHEREKWTSHVEFIMSCVGYAIGLGNVWRFPYLCYQYGGGAFLIPYVITVVLCGIPLFLLETSWGQLLSIGGLGMWKICPLFKGVGFAAAVMAFWLNIYYIVVLAWALFYMWHSLTFGDVSWGRCDNWWNDRFCMREAEKLNCHSMNQSVYNVSVTAGLVPTLKAGHRFCNDDEIEISFGRQSPVKQFFDKRMLGISSDINEVGQIRWELVLALLIAWILAYFCIFRGVKWTGKVVYFTALFPYVMLACLLVRGLTLPGAGKGLEFYLKPDFTKLVEGEVWLRASTQVFFSYGLGLGALVALGSYNVYRNNVYRQALTVCMINSCTSLFAGLVIFAFLGFMAHKFDKEVKDVADQGPGLLFLAYPTGILELPLTALWAVLFFAMVVFIGLDSQFCTLEGFITAIIDEWPHVIRGRKYGRELFTLCVCIVSFVLGLSTVTEGGMYVFQLFDTYAASGWALLWLLFFECVAISWSVGIGRWYDHMKDMIGYYPNIWWKFCWVVATPGICASVMIYSLANYKSPEQMPKVRYPIWAELFGWFMALSSMVCIPVYAIHKWFVTAGSASQCFGAKGPMQRFLKKRRSLSYSALFVEKSGAQSVRSQKHSDSRLVPAGDRTTAPTNDGDSESLVEQISIRFGDDESHSLLTRFDGDEVGKQKEKVYEKHTAKLKCSILIESVQRKTTAVVPRRTNSAFSFANWRRRVKRLGHETEEELKQRREKEALQATENAKMAGLI